MRIITPYRFAEAILFGLTITAASASGQNVLFVDAARLEGLQNGSGWSDAYADLQDALGNAATNGLITEIRVAQGGYRPDDGTGDRTRSFRMLGGVTLAGGYAGFGAVDPDMRDVIGHPSVLSGDLAGDDATTGNAENSFHVVDSSGVGVTAVLDGFVITGGNANGPAPHDSGGGLLNILGRPTLMDCTFRANTAAQDGGGMFISGQDSSPAIMDCNFESNTAGARGGALFNDNAGGTVDRAALSNCALVENSAPEGGALYNFGGHLTMIGSAFIDNEASSEGGAVYNFTSDAMFEGCTFGINRAVRGGAMRNSSSRPVVTRCVFSGNLATDDGGAMLNQNAGPTLSNSAFVGNVAANQGGAVWSFNTLAFEVRNCTFYGNQAADKGGALYNWGTTGGGSNPQIVNCILWGNRDAGGPDESGQMHTDRGAPVVNYSCVQKWTGALGGVGNISKNPRLQPDGMHVSPLSPCIDAGDPAFIGLPSETDLDGAARVVRARVDMGADESALPPVEAGRPTPGIL